MAVPIHLAYLDRPTPRWSDALIAGVADVFPNPVRQVAAAVDIQTSFEPARQQHHATLVLAALVRQRNEAGAKMLGVIAADLFLPVLTFVFGQAQLDGPGAIVSTFRLRSEFYGLPSDEGVLVERTIKECVHELGHAFGLVHCEAYDCVMHSSTTVDEVDLKRSEFCAQCRSRLQDRGWK